MLAPGNSIGTITVQGNLTFNAGSIYASSSPDRSRPHQRQRHRDDLAGTVQAIALPGSFTRADLHHRHAAGGVNGTFGSLTTTVRRSSSARAIRIVTYDANEVLLTLDPGTAHAAAGGVGVNQRRSPTAINNFVLTGGTLPPASTRCSA